MPGHSSKGAGQMLDLRPTLLVIGILLTTLGAAMLVPALIDLQDNHTEWVVFTASSGFTLFVGVSLTMATWGRTGNLSIKQAIILTTVSWVTLAGFAAIPLAWSRLDLSYTNAFFEAMSGLTTTGSTIITNLDEVPRGILLWRALLQWLGGIGIIVMAIAVLPMLQIGGMQLFRMESSDTSDKILPRATQIAGSITLVYIIITLLNVFAYVVAGMGLFDAVAHSMATIATGGFSTYDASMAQFDSAAIEGVTIVFMIAGSLPFVLFLQALRGDPGALWKDSQVRFFLLLISISVAIAFFYLVSVSTTGVTTAFRLAAFNIVSVTTGTGYATTDYGVWGPFAQVFFFSMMFIGGCAGSASCGIKVFRIQIIFQNVRTYIKRIAFPHGVFSTRFNNRVLPDNVSASVMSFLYLYFLCFGILSIALNLTGLDNLTALSAAASAMANVGPGLGPVLGPSGTYAEISDTAKWLLSFGMLLGRLELLTVLVIFTPAFWQE